MQNKTLAFIFSIFQFALSKVISPNQINDQGFITVVLVTSWSLLSRKMSLITPIFSPNFYETGKQEVAPISCPKMDLG